jgi:hypothetical protein
MFDWPACFRVWTQPYLLGVATTSERSLAVIIDVATDAMLAIDEMAGLLPGMQVSVAGVSTPTRQPLSGHISSQNAYNRLADCVQNINELCGSPNPYFVHPNLTENLFN